MKISFISNLLFINYFIDESIRTSKSSLFELNQLLQYVKEKFSEVLLPAEVVTRLDFLGKGCTSVIYVSCLYSSHKCSTHRAVKLRFCWRNKLTGLIVCNYQLKGQCKHIAPLT